MDKVPQKIEDVEEKQAKEIDSFAIESADIFWGQIVNKSFTLTIRDGRKKKYIVKVMEDKKNPGQVVSSGRNVGVIDENAQTYGLNFSDLLDSLEGDKLISTIMDAKKVPANIQTKVKKRIIENNH